MASWAVADSSCHWSMTRFPSMYRRTPSSVTVVNVYRPAAKDSRLGPANREVVRGYGRVRSVEVPDEVDGRIGPGEHRRAGQVAIGEVLADERRRRGVASRCTWRRRPRGDHVPDGLTVGPAREVGDGAVRGDRRWPARRSRAGTRPRRRSCTACWSARRRAAASEPGGFDVRVMCDLRGRMFTDLVVDTPSASVAVTMTSYQVSAEASPGGGDGERTGSTGQRTQERMDVRAVVETDLGGERAVGQGAPGEVDRGGAVVDGVAGPVQRAIGRLRRP